MQVLCYEEDPEDGLFWMAKDDALSHFWTFTVCMLQGNASRTEEASNMTAGDAPSMHASEEAEPAGSARRRKGKKGKRK